MRKEWKWESQLGAIVMIQAKEIYHDAHEAYPSRRLASTNLLQGALERALECTLMLKCSHTICKSKRLIEPDELSHLF